MSEPLWKPSPERIASAQLTRFQQSISDKYNIELTDYRDLHRWSVERIADFWSEIWRASKIVHSASYDSELDDPQMPGAKWFSGSRLNFAENLLRYSDERTAIVQIGENVTPREISYAELRSRVSACAAGLRELGVRKGDRVAAFMPNIPEAVIGMLATTSLGALWSSCSPDFGRQGALDRFGQIEPKVILAANGYRYNGKAIDSLSRVSEIASNIPSIEKVVVVSYLGSDLSETPANSLRWEELLSDRSAALEFEQTEFDHPVYIMYSSGTTGKPKCIAHGAGGTLLQHWKEHALHTDLSREDVLFYFTTCGWMMWNWLVSGLQIGCAIVLYEGSPSYPDIETLWRAVDDHKISVFGTSPKFLTACQKRGLIPSSQFKLDSLRSILSTGSPLTAENYRWVYEAVKSDVQLASISGGTDIISCFMLGAPTLPVYSEEIQCLGLGMDVAVYSDEGDVLFDQVGELVCRQPFPSAPVGFWNDSDGSKYRAAYFERFPGVWRHGDFIKITERGGVIVYGRSDTTLNPGGVRIGAAEIYNPVEALAEIVDSVVIAQQWRGDVRIVLFVVLAEGVTLTDDLRATIKSTIRKSATPRHVPSVILQATDVPRTISGKKVEIAVTRLVHGREVTNRDALANPESLDQFRDIPQLQ